MADTQIIQFSNSSQKDWKLVKDFVRFHWDHYEKDNAYIPLLNYEYLGHRLLGMVALKFRDRAKAKTHFQAFMQRVSDYPSEQRHKPYVQAMLNRLK